MFALSLIIVLIEFVQMQVVFVLFVTLFLFIIKDDRSFFFPLHL